MSRRLPTRSLAPLLSIAALFSSVPLVKADAPSAAATAGFDRYVRTVETRLDRQHQSATEFLAPEDLRRLRSGELIIENLIPAGKSDLPGAMLHDWRGTAFAPGATPADFDRLMRNFQSYPQTFAPQVVRSTAYPHSIDRYQVTMRVRQKQVLTVVMDTTYDVTFGSLDTRHGWSASRSTSVREIDDPGTPSEHPLSDADSHGFLWRLNTYWSYEEADGGLYLQIESISLTRSIPTGLGWAVRPFVESVPQDSLQFTLRKTCQALRPTSALAKEGSR